MTSVHRFAVFNIEEKPVWNSHKGALQEGLIFSRYVSKTGYTAVVYRTFYALGTSVMELFYYPVFRGRIIT